MSAIWSQGQDMGGGDADAADWRTRLPDGSRQRIVNKIMHTLKSHLPLSGEEAQEVIKELEKIAVRFEETTYTGATSELDYLRKIALMMLTFETRRQDPTANFIQFNAAGNSSQNTHDPASLDSSSQTGNANGGDWQEEVFQKIRSMNTVYFPELNEIYQKVAAKLQQHDSLPQQPKNEPFENSRAFKVLLERIILFLQIPKTEVKQNHKEKIIAVEKQINNILNSYRLQKPVSSMPQGQLSQPHSHTVQQSLQPQSQISQMHPHENQMNSQMQLVNVQGSMSVAQQNNVTNSQNNSSSVSGVSIKLDYLRKIALMMLTFETRRQDPTANFIQFNAAGNSSQNTHDPASLDSSSQTGNANGGDWQEEVFQKIRSMNTMYFLELNEIYQKVAAKLQQHDSLPQQPKNERFENLRVFKVLLERIILFLRIPKTEVKQNHKEKIVAVEKQINNILNSYRLQKPVSSMPQGQLSQPHLHTVQQSLQPQSQISQMHPHENQMNSQMQLVNVQGSMSAAQHNNVNNSQNNSSSVSGVSIKSDYLRKIALKMLTFETRLQDPTANFIQFNAAGNTSQKTHDPGLMKQHK